jgi:cell division protein FtsB
MIEVAEDELKKELGYTEGKINIQKLVKFIKESLAKKQVSLYEIDYLKIGSDGKIQLPADLASDPSKIEKLIVSLVNKRVVDQLIYGEAYIQGSGVGFEKYSKPTEKDLETYGTNGLLFYRPVDKDGNVTDDPDKAVAIKSMQVKVALQGDFVKLLELEGLDGKKIETIDRLNAAIKNEEWLDKNDHRKMITLGGTRIPTASMNYIDTMEIAEFLPASAGNILILPSEIVAKSGADYDIDKMIIIRPVISNNRGVIELTRPKATTRTLEEIAAEKKNIKDYISTIYDDYNEYIDEARKQRLSFTSEQKEEFNAIRNKYRNPINALRKELNAAYDKFISDPNATNASYQETEDSLQSQIDKLTEEESALKKQFLKRVFGENFLNETLDRRNKELEEENEKLRELNRESDSFKARAYQNEILDNWSELILRKDNYTALTIPNSTDLFTDKETGIVKDFRPINRKQEVISSPTKIMQNTYNIDKAIAMASGKMGIGMLATGATFFNLYKSVGLSMNPDSTVYNTAGTKSWIVKNVLRTKHNGSKTEMGQDVISLSHALDANKENDIAEVVSQIMNGYLDVAKDDWVFDINATKEFESEVES